MEIVSPSGGGDVSALAENVIVQANDRNAMRGGQSTQQIKPGVAAPAHSGFSEDYQRGAVPLRTILKFPQRHADDNQQGVPANQLGDPVQ